MITFLYLDSGLYSEPTNPTESHCCDSFIICDFNLTVKKNFCSMKSEASTNYVWSRGKYEDDVYPSPPWYTSLMVFVSSVILITLSKFANWLRDKGVMKVQSATELENQKVKLTD